VARARNIAARETVTTPNDDRRVRRPRRFIEVEHTAAAIVFLAAGMSCRVATDATPANATSGRDVPGVSLVLEPSSVSVGPGGSTQSIGTIRGASGTVLSSVTGMPDNVSVRVTSVTTTDSVVTKKYIVFADAAAVPGRYALTVRATASGYSDVEAPLSLTVTAP
jgi:hypothetical protein